MKTVKAKKQYVCDLTGKTINVGDMYIRSNIRNVGIYHFSKSCDEYKIKDYLYSEVYYSKEYEEHEYECDEALYDSFEEEIWASMPDEF